MRNVNGRAHDSKQPWNPALAGPELQAVRERLVALLRERSLDQPPAPSAPSKPVDPPRPALAQPVQSELPFDPPLPPAKRRSRNNAVLVRDITRAMGRSEPYVRAMLRVLASGNGSVIGAVLSGRITVNKAQALIG